MIISPGYSHMRFMGGWDIYNSSGTAKGEVIILATYVIAQPSLHPQVTAAELQLWKSYLNFREKQTFRS